jgi:hypothetical protein
MKKKKRLPKIKVRSEATGEALRIIKCDTEKGLVTALSALTLPFTEAWMNSLLAEKQWCKRDGDTFSLLGLVSELFSYVAREEYKEHGRGAIVAELDNDPREGEYVPIRGFDEPDIVTALESYDPTKQFVVVLYDPQTEDEDGMDYYVLTYELEM